jgi:hypothetical protein
MKTDVFNKLTAFLGELEQKKISYTLAHNRDEAIMVIVAAPGERWEIEFLSDGSVEIEKFISSGAIYGENILGDLFARYADQEDDSSSFERIELIAPESKAA